MKENLRTKNAITWCPSCPNNMILESTKRALTNLIKQGRKKENFAIATGIGCHGKIFDYLNVSGFYGLHGRVLPTALGIKLGNPNLTVLGFAGDGDTYSEGIGHFISMGRYNPNITLIVHDNQSFSLTTGQATPTSQQGYKTKSEPLGEFNLPLNPIKLAISSGATFVARCNARDINHTSKIIEQAIKHKGFSFVEILQDCIIFNLKINNKDKLMYKIPTKNRKIKEALSLADEWDYNLRKGKIPLGIFYQEKRKTLEEKWPQLSYLQKKKISWKDLKK
ncbi:hypothetical protein CMI40_02310 [Candidatus Pacearchaeota archaeon]|jgi:2-oxoglutarate ferredoxin oxidoreductase subunit beta|nr:hypothetical protein [Candidatus Pacearchaeota archaeon]|tara:strand:+ start:2568 stop:3404 length:837 start_codon:yes stop_codon:yes gene_type:complete